MDHPRDPRAGSRPALIARVARWLRPPRTLRPTRAGWTFFALTFGVGFAALNTGNNLLYLVLSSMLSFLVLSGVLSESALRGIQIRRRLPRELFAGAASRVGLDIANQQRRVAAFAVVVEDRIAQGGEPMEGGRAFCLRVGPGDVERRSYGVTPGRRGAIEFAGFRVSTRFPFGLFTKSLTLTCPEHRVAYPEVEPVAAPVQLGAAREGSERAIGPSGAGAQAAGLRDFAPGDPVRRVHWRASLRRRALLLRDLEHEHDAEVEVRLRTSGAVPGEPFERSVRWAASEVVSLIAADARVALRTDASYIPPDSGPAQRARLLAFLALVEPRLPEAA